MHTLHGHVSIPGVIKEATLASPPCLCRCPQSALPADHDLIIFHANACSFTAGRRINPFYHHRWRIFCTERQASTSTTSLGRSFTDPVIRSNFRYTGTNAYWLPVLNTDEDVRYTLGNISAIGMKVVRLWAFNGEPSTCRSNPDYSFELPRC